MSLAGEIVLLGDVEWMLPLAVIAAMVLACGGHWAKAVQWLATYGGGIIIIWFGKIAFDFGGHFLPRIDFYSISGHAMQSTAVYPFLFATVASLSNRGVKWVGFGLGCGVAFPIGCALYIGNFHTLSEILAGAMIGAPISFLNCMSLPLRLSFRREVAVVVLLLSVVVGWVCLNARCGSMLLTRMIAAWQYTGNKLGATRHYYRVICFDVLTGKRFVRVEFYRRNI